MMAELRESVGKGAAPPLRCVVEGLGGTLRDGQQFVQASSLTVCRLSVSHSVNLVKLIIHLQIFSLASYLV